MNNFIKLNEIQQDVLDIIKEKRAYGIFFKYGRWKNRAYLIFN